MGFLTFIDSTAALSPWFEALVRLGFSFQEPDLTKALPAIREIGLRMETEMFEATGNINTQKGIIFLMGLSLFACGKIFSQGDHFDRKEFQSLVREICKDIVLHELSNISQNSLSHGEMIFLKHGYSGARGEAESGFQTVFESGLPWLEGVEFPDDKAMTRCLLSVAAINNDSNILYRRGPEVLSVFQKLCHQAAVDFNEANYEAVAEFCRIENISPGGSADLLAISIFVWSVQHADPCATIPPMIPQK
jgi:holo-ACP synthase/triphosphoribosyl-dephospho-CoA synthase